MKVQFIKKNQPACRLVFFNELHFHGSKRRRDAALVTVAKNHAPC